MVCDGVAEMNNEELYRRGHGFVAFRMKGRRDSYARFLRRMGHKVTTGRSWGPTDEGDRYVHAYYVNTTRVLRPHKKARAKHHRRGRGLEGGILGAWLS